VAVQIAVVRTAETHAAVRNAAVLTLAPLSEVRIAVRIAVIHAAVPNVAAQSAAIRFWFQDVIRVAPIVAQTAARILALVVVRISVQYAARCVVANQASRVHDVPHGVLHGVLHDDFRVTAP
jgi:hypothetical protein